jgi:hypothetical protein
MVSIDTVYQRVLALANKEQRGYITPQEFNLFANQAQMEIFEQYFYDLNQFSRVHDNYTEHASMTRILEEKIGEIEIASGPSIVAGWDFMGDPSNITLPKEVYRVSRVVVNGVRAERLNRNDWNDVRRLFYLAATPSRPIYNIRRGILRVNDGTSVSGNAIGIHYVPTPPTVQWGYIVINEKALYDAETSINFQLHVSEEVDLVYKILKFAGVALEKDQIMRAGQGMEMAKTQQEKQ